MENLSKDKIGRVLSIYTKLMNGGVVRKEEAAIEYGVNERSIQRDIEDIREFVQKTSNYLENRNSIIYDRNRKGYYLERRYLSKFSCNEVWSICKILLDEQVLTKGEIRERLQQILYNKEAE